MINAVEIIRVLRCNKKHPRPKHCKEVKCTCLTAHGGCADWIIKMEAADLIEAQSAEIDRLTADIEGWEKSCETRDQMLRNLTAQLSESQHRERGAVAEIEALLAEDIESCEACGNTKCYRKGGTGQWCEPKWRGPREAERLG